jgi:hypothetical protein
MPCRTCKDNVREIEGTFRMRFICDPNGRLLKGAPGNYKCGEVYMQPFHLSKFSYWELVEDKPVLKIPEATQSDSVFEETIFVPDDDAASVEMSTPPTEVAGVNVDPDAPALIEPYMRLDLNTGQLTAVSDEPKPQPKTEQVEAPKTREELKAILDARGAEYAPKIKV